MYATGIVGRGGGTGGPASWDGAVFAAGSTEPAARAAGPGVSLGAVGAPGFTGLDGETEHGPGKQCARPGTEGGGEDDQRQRHGAERTVSGPPAAPGSAVEDRRPRGGVRDAVRSLPGRESLVPVTPRAASAVEERQRAGPLEWGGERTGPREGRDGAGGVAHVRPRQPSPGWV